MEVQYYLVCLQTMQLVEIASSICTHDRNSVSSTYDRKALALFCYAHAGMNIEMLSLAQLKRRNLDQGDLVKWNDANAENCFKALEGDNPPNHCDQYSA